MRAVEFPTDGQLWYRNEFLKSDEWKETSKKIIEAADYECYLCGTSSAVFQAHHIFYDNYDLCNPDSLVCLCRECHKCTHDVINDFENLPNKVVMSTRECADFLDKAILKYYISSYLHHDDAYNIFELNNFKNLRRFVGIQLAVIRPNLTIYNDYSVLDKKGFPTEGYINHAKEYVKKYVAHYVELIDYTYPTVSHEDLRKHFKLGNKAWENVLILVKKYKERYKNMKSLDLTNVTATQGGDFPRVTPGGYVIGIVAVEDVPEKEYLKITYDIAEGELKNYYYEMHQRTGYDLPCFYKSYKEKALGFFKAFIDAVIASNAGYTWNNDERTLCRKLVGCVLREEEYRNRDGEIKVSLKPDVFYPVADIRAGKFDVPPKKTLSNAPSAAPAAGYGTSTVNYTPAANAPLTSAQTAAEDMVIFSGDGVPF